MMVGPFAWVLSAFGVASKGDRWLSPADATYSVVVALILLSRWWEFRSGSGLTADGRPASAADLRRFLWATSVAGLILWGLATLAAQLEFLS